MLPRVSDDLPSVLFFPDGSHTHASEPALGRGVPQYRGDGFRENFFSQTGKCS